MGHELQRCAISVAAEVPLKAAAPVLHYWGN